jgi:hypothetical protein
VVPRSLTSSQDATSRSVSAASWAARAAMSDQADDPERGALIADHDDARLAVLRHPPLGDAQIVVSPRPVT